MSVKNYPSIGCCGIDCGLCPRHYTVGSSKCPGCYGPHFPEKHPGCPIITCCVKKKGLEVCAECEERHCSKLEGFESADSFVTHKRCHKNLDTIRQLGIDRFKEAQDERVLLLEGMLEGFDDGRSKSFFCLSAALLPLSKLRWAFAKASSVAISPGKKEKAALLRKLLEEAAREEGIELSLDNKGKY